MSIKKSIRILLIAASMIPVILVSFLAHGFLTNKLIDVNTNNLVRTSITSISGLESLINNQQTEVTLLSLQNELINYVRQSNRTGYTVPDSMNELLKERCNIYNGCEYILLYNKRQEIIASSDSQLIGTRTQSEKSLNYMFTTKEIAIGKDGLKLINKGNEPIYTLDIGSPILDPSSGMVLGYIVSTINTNYFKNYLNSLIIDETGFAILLDEGGNMIYHPNANLIGTTINPPQIAELATRYNNGFIEKSGSFQNTYEGRDQVYGYCVLPQLNWILLMKQDIASIKSLTNFMLSLLTTVCLLLLIVISLCTNFVAKQYSTPIIALRDAMRTASDGNLTVQSNIKCNNEIGELSKNFNKMLHIIRTNYQDLESMHEELLLNEEQLRSNYDHIEYLAYHDTLTNLPNKLAFFDHVNAVLMSSSPQKDLHASYFVDLDNFKTVNDTLGHEYGDALLVKTAALLASVLHSDGMLARAGGDEFLLFRDHIPSTEDAVLFAAKIIDLFKDPLDLDGEIVYVSMSIGISIYPENGLTSNVLIKNADIAMYKSKDTGKNKFTLFDRKMEEELSRHTLIIDVLRNAIENNEIYLQYQPLMELKTNSIVGFEALMRIYNKKLGYINPSEFIPIAEESGLIIQLSSWLLKEACTFTKHMLDSGAKPRSVSVNISSVQINRPGFISTLSEILEETKLPPEYLELEITESTLVSSLLDATILLKNLQNIGVKISLDDFGTGYSSLNYLTKMPINTLKIDKSFIDNICTSEKDSCIAESIIQLAHSLDIQVVAEGVEQEEQLCLLRAKRCDIIQGYVYSPPLHPEDLLEAIKEDDLVTQCSLF